MKKILMMSVFVAAALVTNAQTSAGSSNGTRQTRKSSSYKRKSATQLRGSGQYHGSKDTTPGSPMGTGGAGGNEMSGSPASSASETAIQSSKPDTQSTDQVGSEGSAAKKATMKKKTTGHKNRRM